MVGSRVRVWHRQEAGRDRFGEPQYTWLYEDVENVIVRPLVGAELASPDRPDGVRVTVSLAFPKGYDASTLYRAMVELVDSPWHMGGSMSEPSPEALQISGRPLATDPAPTAWNIVCEAGRTDG